MIKKRKSFEEAGVIFVILPNISGSRINGATKKIGDNIRLKQCINIWF